MSSRLTVAACLAAWTIVGCGSVGRAPVASPAAVAKYGDLLIAAAQRQEVERVGELLARGADVDSRTRYGATALFFACDKGNLELVELLLEHGAEVDVTDTFYGATPLGWTLYSAAESAVHREIALRLLERGPADAEAALLFGARQGDLELVEAAVESGEIEPAALLAPLEQAREAGHRDIVDYLAARSPEEAPARVVSVPPERLAAYVGDYRNGETGTSRKVFLEGGELKIQGAGQEASSLEPTAEDVFTAPGSERVEYAFRGRGGLIEGFRLRRGSRELFFARVEGGAGESAETPGELPPLPEAERISAIHWPRFRGAGAAGIGDGQGAPSRWHAERGHNIRWKTRIPGLGHSSPVIWGERVFVTTAVAAGGDESLRTGLYGDVDSVDDDSVHTWKVYALDKSTGEILWQQTASEGRPKTKRHLKSTQANPTPATDGRHLVVHFGSEGLFCYDLDGNLRWRREQGALQSGWFFDSTYEWGFSSSPILHGDKVITQVDVEKGSFIAAYDLATGREVWRTERDEIPTWGTPVILAGDDGTDEIVTNGTTIRGYDVVSGDELWRLGPNSEITVASPVAADGIAYVTGGYPPVRPIYAVQAGGRGNLSLPEGETASEHVAWSSSRGGAYIPTPIVYRGILYVLQNNGRLSAYEAATGQRLYRERLEATSFSASPVAADGRLYFTSEAGTTYVVRAGEAFEILEANELGEVVMTTPAISDGLILMRGAQHLYGLGEEPRAP